MQKKILITGATGMIGGLLSQKLIDKGFEVACLSRRKKDLSPVKCYTWDVEKGEIEAEALENVDYIIHLAGAGIADKRWTEKRKKEIIQSRVQSAELLFKTMQAQAIKPKAYLTASGISIYGDDKGSTWLDEESPLANSFLAQVAKAWENSSQLFENEGIRTVQLRIGIVLGTEGGALPKLAKPVRYGVGAALGSGKQYTSWIHIEDVCNFIVQAIEQESIMGAYNLVAPQPVNNQDFTKLLAEVLQKPLFLPSIPSFMLKMLLGEMSATVLGSLRVSAKKMENTSFEFTFPELKGALEDLLLP